MGGFTIITSVLISEQVKVRGDVMRKAEVRVMEPQAKDCQPSPETRKSLGRIPSRVTGPADNLILDLNSLQNCNRIHFYCFMLSSLWYFVTAALGNHISLNEKKK